MSQILLVLELGFMALVWTFVCTPEFVRVTEKSTIATYKVLGFERKAMTDKEVKEHVRLARSLGYGILSAGFCSQWFISPYNLLLWLLCGITVCGGAWLIFKRNGL